MSDDDLIRRAMPDPHVCCPACGAAQEYTGDPVVYCPACRWCLHPSLYRAGGEWVCDVCARPVYEAAK